MHNQKNKNKDGLTARTDIRFLGLRSDSSHQTQHGDIMYGWFGPRLYTLCYETKLLAHGTKSWDKDGGVLDVKNLQGHEKELKC